VGETPRIGIPVEDASVATKGDSVSPSVTSPVWEFEEDEPVFKMAHVGAQAGGERIGACLYELGPGARTGPLHIHRANEELLVVLSGSPVVRRPSGEREQLQPGSVISFPAGNAGAHAIEQDGPGTTRLLVMSTMRFPDVVEHPEDDRVLIMHGPPADGTEFLLFRRSDGSDVLPGG
jgi:uncharacterized cupin superfamily protein